MAKRYVSGYNKSFFKLSTKLTVANIQNCHYIIVSKTILTKYL